MNLLQIGIFIDFIPEWLGPFLLTLGLVVTIGLYLKTMVEDGYLVNEIPNDNIEGKTAYMMAFIGVGGLIISSYSNNSFIYAGLMLMSGRWIEGVAASRFISKVSKFLSDSSSEGNFLASYVKKRAYRFSGFMTFLFTSGWVIIYGFILGFGDEKTAVQLVFIWTILVGTVSLFGLMWRFRLLYRIAAADATGELDQSMSSFWLMFGMTNGLLIAIVGAQLYNLELLEAEITAQGIEIGLSLTDLVVPIVGNIVYIAGFIIGVKLQW